MDLGSLWQWNPRKLPCSVRQDAGNPTVDDLREKLAEIAGVNLRDIIDDFKKTKMSSSADTQNDFETNKKYKEILSRSHVVGAVQQALESVEPKRDTEKSSTSISLRNIKKTYYLLPKSPPKRVLMELNREIAKPLVLPNQDDSKAVTARLEKKLAKQRAVRRNNTEEVVLKTLIDQDIQSPVVDAANILKKWSGDLFSSCDVLIPGGYLGGMIYLSRMADSENKSNKKYEINNDVTSFDSTKTTEEKDEKVGKNIIGDEKNSTLPISSSGVDTEAKLYCAKALCNWARNPANAKRLAEEGAVNAIITLAKEPNLRISFFCAGAFRFMSESLIIATLMIDEGNAISTISDMIKNGQSDDVIVGNLTIALVNLTRVNGKEGQTVEAMLHQALMFVLQGFPDLSSTCARGLYNLTCVDATYPLIEKVIRALIQLSSSTNTANVKHVCAAALCNLADLKSVRLRLVEEGVISIIGLLVKNAETRTRRVCAVILQNLSAAKSCRVEMVSRSAVQAAHLLSSDSDPIILRCIGLTLSRLAIDHNNSTRIIHELGIAALCNIAVKFPTVAGISQPVSTAFQLLSSNAGVRLTIVQEGSVAAIASLMKNSQDIYTLQHCLLALCNLLYEHDNHLSIVQQGLIVTMITLSSHENDTLRDLTSLAFLNLSYADDSRKHAVNAGGVVAIIGLTRGKSNVTKRRCAAALCNLSSQSTVMDRMVADGVIPCLVKLVTSNDLETVRYACAALCRLCATKENGQLIMFSGAVPNLVQGAIKGDAGTQQYCGAVLSSLSSYESCRVQLFDTGIISALRTLAALNDDVTKQRCLSAFANLSCEESIQLKMVEQGVVSIISDLADSYQEITFMYCAQALCNLACNDEARLQVASEGGVRAMMMISMVRSVDMRTKQLCITALSNLLDDSTIQYLLGEGIVGSIANLSKMDNPKTLHLCAILFNQLTFYPEACLKIAERYVPLSTIFSMVHAANVETRIVAARTTCNLLFSKEVRDKAIEAGALGALQAGIESGNEDAASHCLRALFSSSKDLKILIFIAQTTIPLAVCSFAIKYSDEKHDIALKILSLLSWHIESRKYIQNKAFATILIKLAITNLQRSSYQNLALVFRYFCLGFQDHRELLEAGIMSAVEAIYDMNDPSDFEVSSALADVIRSLAEIPECVIKLSTHKIITILKSILDICYSDVKTMYNVCVIIYCLASHGSESRLATASSITVTALLILSSYPEVSIISS